MWDPNLDGPSVKLPIDFDAEAVTYPLQGKRDFIFQCSGELQVELPGCQVKLRREKQDWCYPI